MDTNVGSSSVEILRQYKLGRNLGIGSFGKVRLAQHANGQEVAIKIINRQTLDGVDLERVLREIKILRLLEHPHIVRLYNAIETQTEFYIFMEYVKGGELYDYVSDNVRIGEAEARRIFQQIISGIEFCHLNRVVHRDLKMENVLLDSERNVKIIDFGLSNIMQDGRFFKTFCGSPDYAAPEILSGKLYAGPEVDVWSCGVILYTLLCQRLPFEADNLPLLYQKIKSGKFVQPIYSSDAATDLIRRILVVDPIKRLTIPEIRQHPWFCDHHLHHLPVTNTIPLVEKGPIYTGSHHQHMDTTEHLDLCLRPQSTSKESKWAIGLQSGAPPAVIMAEVLQTFKRLNVCWKKIGHYTMKCKWLPNLPRYPQPAVDTTLRMNSFLMSAPANTVGNVTGGVSDAAVKFEMQLYKTPDEKYLLDLQRVNGSPFLFLQICSEFMAQLLIT